MRHLVLAPLLAALIALSGCAGYRMLPAPAEAPATLPPIAGMPEDARIRFWGDLSPAVAEAELRVIRRQIAAQITKTGFVPNGGRYNILALSGGGSDGAYGAGLLNGWSDRPSWPPAESRPEFTLVTGISVGALMAPLAFLGPDYDDELERLFTNTSTADLLDFNVFSAVLGYSLGLADVRPMADMLSEIIDSNLVQRIAEEHRKGRRLWIGTTYLDAERPVIWDIGAIAVSDFPRKALLIRKILLASSAIPGAFPPVEFAVEIDGRVYSEMHVDGSVTRQLFAFPREIGLGVEMDDEIPGMAPGTIYLVRNSKLARDYSPVEPAILAILERSLFTLTNALALGDVETISQRAKAEGWRLLSSAVPPEFDVISEDFFDPSYMRALYEIGYERAASGSAWTTLHDPGPDDPSASGKAALAAAG